MTPEKIHKKSIIAKVNDPHIALRLLNNNFGDHNSDKMIMQKREEEKRCAHINTRRNNWTVV